MPEEPSAELAKLWPHRLHESNCFKNLLCWLGLHRWASLDLHSLLPGEDVEFCRWCMEIRRQAAVKRPTNS